MLYVFQAVFPSIIRSSKLHIWQQANACCRMCSFDLPMMDRKTTQNK